MLNYQRVIFSSREKQNALEKDPPRPLGFYRTPSFTATQVALVEVSVRFGLETCEKNPELCETITTSGFRTMGKFGYS